MWLYLVTPEGRPLNAITKMAERVLEAAERLQDPYLESLTYLLLSFDPLQRGHLGAAGEWAEKLIDLGKRTGYSTGAVARLGVRGLGRRLRGRSRQGLGGQRACGRRLAWAVRADHVRQRPRRGADRRGARR